MSNPTAPATELSIGGSLFKLRFDFEAIADAEEQTGRSLLTGLRKQDIEAPKINLVRAMLFACIHDEHPTVTYDKVKELVNRKNLAEVWRAVLAAWTEGLAEPEDTPAADPTTGRS